MITSIHAPSEGSDRGIPAEHLSINKLQSTLPAKGATISNSNYIYLYSDFNPRSQRRERLSAERQAPKWTFTSIHAPSEGSDISDSIEMD